MNSREKAMEKLLTEYTFSVQINMNDTFHWACADAGELSSDDVEDMLPLIDKFGFYALVAYEAIKRGYNPEAGLGYDEDDFKQLKSLILKMMEENENFLPDLNYNYRKEQKQIKDYGGILSFKFVNPTVLEKTMGQNYMTCVCTVDGTKGKFETKDTNMYGAEKKLRELMGLENE